MNVDVEGARHDWQEGYRRLLAEDREPGSADLVAAQVEIVGAELRRRLGSTFTLAELALEYRGSEAWAREVVSERLPERWSPGTLAVAGDAAFHLYSRGAVDFEP